MSSDPMSSEPMSSEPTSVESLTSDFHGTLAGLRERTPVAWIPDLGGWMVTSRLLVSEILRDPVQFTVDDERFSTQRVIGPSMLSLDGVEHVRHRAPFDQAFRRGNANELQTRITRLANDLVSGFADEFRADLRTSLAAPLAVSVMVDALGLVDVDASELLSWYADIVSSTTQTSLGANPSAAGRVAMGHLEAAIRRSLEASDLLIRAAETLTVEELVSNVAVLLFGGVETSEAMTANALVHLLSEPHLVDELLQDQSLVTAFVDESVRIEPAAAQLDRYATTDVVLGGTQIRAGDFVMCSIAAANRDPAHFDNPNQFRLGRTNVKTSLSFAVGPHACLATHVAKAETEAAVRSVLARLPNIRLIDNELIDNEPPPRIEGIVFRKATSVPTTWTPKVAP
jgi:cytochrome P450